MKRVRVDGDVELECQEQGSGDPALVLLHGYTGSRDDFREHMAPLARHGRTLALDQRGHGGASNPGTRAGYTLERLRDDLAAALTGLDASPCDLLGHSMGGMVALRYALAHPDRVRSLILMDTSASPLRIPAPFRLVMAGVRQLARRRGMGPMARMMRRSMEKGPVFRGPPVQAPDAYDNSFHRVGPKLEQLDPEAFASLGEVLFEAEPLVERLAEIRCPTTVVVGESDKPFRRASEVLANRIAGAELVVVPLAAHQPQLENPTAWRRTVEAHLARVR